MSALDDAPNTRRTSRRGAVQRMLAVVASAALLGAGMVAVESTAVSALTLQSPTVIYQDDVNGDYVLVGNGVLRSTGAAAAGGPSVNQLHNGTAGANYVNDMALMANNTVADLPGAANGSNATLSVPAGASIVKAQLSWAGNLGQRKDRNGNVVSGYACGDYGAAAVPSGSASTQTLQLKVGSSSVQSVATANYFGETIAATANSNSNYYSASQDVTSIFQAAMGVSDGTVQTVSVGNLWAATGAGCFAGWSLTVVYDFGQLIAGNAASAGRNVVLYSGHVRQASADPAVTINFDGFETLDTNSRLGVTLYEGDRNITGDTVSYRPGTSGAFTPLSNASGLNQTNNFGVSTADGSVRYAGNGTGQFFNASVDARSQSLPLASGSTSMQLQLSTSGDSYLWQNAVLSTSSARVTIKKQALDGTDTQAVNVGGTPTFRITVSNNGSIALGNITISDPLAADCVRTAGASGVPTSLAPLASFTYTCAGPATTDAWTNTASVRAVAQGGSNRVVTSSDPSNVVVSKIGLTKSGSVPAGAKSGQLVTYTFTATNTGSTTLTGVTITDPKPNLSTITYGAWPSGTAGTLAPGQSVTATATYPLTQADVNAGTVTNTASVTGSGPNSTTATATAPASVSITDASALTLTKSGVLNGAGTTITYSFTATNTGNLPLSGVAITDPLLTAGSISYGTWPSGTTGLLNPGQSVTATASYPVTQANTNAGVVNNTATITGTPPRGAAPTASASAQVTLPRTSAIDLTKTGALAATGTPPKAGDIVTYRFTAGNTGNTTLTGVSISDPLTGLSALSYGPWPSGTAGTLQPGQSVTATATRALTQADVDAGAVANTATVNGTAPTGPVQDTDTATVPLTRTPAITLTKSGALGGSGNVGDVITYTFTARNSGNTTLSSVTIADPMAGLSTLTYTWPGVAGVLAPGQSVTATASYTLTLADVNSGSVVNTAATSGTAPGGATVDASAPATVPIPQGPAITLTKSGALTSGTSVAGSTVTFTFTVRNSGNVSLNSVGITDQLAGLSSITFGTWPGAANVLNPGQSVTATASYTVTQADVDNGSVRNDATASGTSASGTTVTSPGQATVPLTGTPAIGVTKTGSLSGTGKVGDVVSYSFTVRNIGTVTLHGVTLNDPKAGGAVTLSGWTGATGVLAPGETATGTASYTLTQADVDAGRVDNTATASGLPPTGAAVTGTGSTTVAVPSAPAIQIVKAASPGTATKAGDVITYTFVSTNMGNVTLTGVTIADPLAGLSALTYTWPGTAGTLAPGQHVTATATYTVTQNDVNAGSVVNLASTGGAPPTGAGVTGSDPETVTITSAPALSLTKTGALDGDAKAGSVIDYSFRLTNSGNVTLTGIGITDPLPGLSAVTFGTWPGAANTLQPGQSVDATAAYTVTQADVDRGRVDNTATAGGNPPTGPRTTTTADETVDLAAAPSIALVKTGSLAQAGTTKAGDQVTYTFEVTNNGNVTLDGVGVSDPKSGLSTISFPAWPGAAGLLAPGQSVQGTATYTLTQADVDAGHTANTATASGSSPTDVLVQSVDEADVPLAAAPGIQVEKSGALVGGAVAGDQVEYTFVITNSGNVTLTSVDLRDPLLGAAPLTIPAGSWPGTTGVLAPTQSVTATARYTLTQADVDAGSVVNTATTSGKTPTGATTTGTDGATVPLTAAPGIEITKTASTPATARTGATVTYTFELENTGNVTLTGVGVSDPLPGLSTIDYDWTGTPGTLAPGETVTGTASYVLTQADVDSGSVVNTATASGTPPTGPAVTDIDGATVTLAPAPAITIAKSHTAAGIGEPGDVVTYSFLVTNTGNVTLDDIAIADPLPGLGPISVAAWPGAARTLAPGQSVTATAPYTITQADVDAGSVVNEVSVVGTPPTGASVDDSDGDTVVLPFEPGIHLVKSGVPNGATAGSTITYSFTVTNSGNKTLHDVALSDPKVGGPVTLSGWPGTPGTLAPGEIVTGTASYTLTQADVDAGSVSNTATVASVEPDGATITDQDSYVTTIAPNPALRIVKSGAVGGTGKAGDVVTYSFLVTNSGNVSLTGVGVTDPLPTLSPVTFPATWPSGTVGLLRPGQSITGTATYTLTQADVDRGRVDNTATAAGTPPTGAPVRARDTARVTVAAAPVLQLVKTGALAGGTPVVGSQIAYTFELSNLGNVTISGITLADGLPGLGTISYTWPGANGVLAPGQVATGIANYTLAQADIDSGSVVNSASVQGTPPSGPPVTGGDISTVPVAATPSLSLVKSSSPGSVTAAGQTVTYSFLVTNTGNVTLTGVDVSDPMVGLSDVTFSSWPGAAGVLAPGAQVTGTATYVVTQADVDAGTIVNTASAVGTPPTGDPVDAGDTETITIDPTPSIGLTKTGALQGAPVSGTEVAYTFEITNSGNVTLTDVALQDFLPGLDDVTFGTWPSGTEGTLRPGDTVAVTASYTLTQEDVDAGSVVNTASVVGSSPRGIVVDDDANATVVLPSGASIELTKSAALEDAANPAAGDVATFTFVVRNNGNVSLTSVGLIDGMPGLSAISFGAWPGTEGVLAPGQTVQATASYSLTQADVDRGDIANDATATGTTPTGDPVTGDDTVTVDLPAAPAISVVKTGALDDAAVAGDTVTYGFTVTNTGNVTLTGVGLTDPLTGGAVTLTGWAGVTGTLAPGASVTGTASYTLTQADVDRGSVENAATATGTPPTGDPVTGDDTITTDLPASPAISVVKTGALDDAAVAGDTVTYGFTVTNTGNVTLTGVALVDPLTGGAVTLTGWAGAAGTLAPGASVTGNASYTLTQADVDRGSVENTATATGTPPTGDPVTGDDTITTDLPSASAMTLAKVGSLSGDGAAGDVVTFTFTLTNTGNVTLTDVGLSDPLAGLSAIAFGTWPGVAETLAPGQSVQATATYTLTQADVDRGSVVNTATATGTPPTGDPTTADDTETVPMTAAPEIELQKDASYTGGSHAGDTVDYSFTVTNTGNVTLSQVTIADPLAGLSSIAFGTWPGADGVLAPGQSIEATATYTLTQADVDAGQLANTATVSALPPGCATDDCAVQNDGSALVELTRDPAIGLTKSGTLEGRGRAGDTITYVFVATNTGNVTLRDIAITDALPGLSDVTYDAWPGAGGVLAPGQSVRATASYTLTQADVDAGTVVNDASVLGVSDAAVTVDDADVATVAVTPTPAIVLDKTVDRTASAGPGTTLTYSFVVRNAGNVTLHDVALADNMPGLSAIRYGAWPATVGVLAPGESVTATASYVVTAADGAAGKLTNTATVTGTSPTGVHADGTDSVSIVTTPLPSTGGTFDPAMPIGATLMILVGLGVFLASRRKKETA